MTDPKVTDLARLLTAFVLADDRCTEYHEQHPDASDPPNEDMWARDDAGVEVARALENLLTKGYEIVKAKEGDGQQGDDQVPDHQLG